MLQMCVTRTLNVSPRTSRCVCVPAVPRSLGERKLMELIRASSASASSRRRATADTRQPEQRHEKIGTSGVRARRLPTGTVNDSQDKRIKRKNNIKTIAS